MSDEDQGNAPVGAVVSRHDVFMSRRSLISSIGAAAALSGAHVLAATPMGTHQPAFANPHATELPRNSSGGAPLKQGGLTYSKFKMYQTLDNDMETAIPFPFPFIPDSRFKAVNTGISEPVTQINYEDFYPGPDITWTMYHDEVQYVTSGRAEITYHLAPLMQESATVTAEPGCIYLLPRGARIQWRVLGSVPFRHLCVCIPNPAYPLTVAQSVKSA